MSDRETDARRLAELAGWGYLPANKDRRHAMFSAFGDPTPVPETDDFLSEHLAFVGQIAEAMGRKIGMDHSECLAWCSAVCADAADIPPGDLSHCAIRVAIAALEAKS